MNQIILEDIQALSKERSNRLKRLRNLANMSRKELCDEANININTYIGYEVGRYGGLTQKGADKLIPVLYKKGVFSSSEWLMFGIGPSPQVITNVNEINLQNESTKTHEVSNQEEHNVAEELYLFHKHYRNAIDCRIIDDGMSPKYEMGDFVAGVPSIDLLNKLIGLDCIIQIKNENMMIVRKLQKGRLNGLYTLVSINPKTVVIQPIIYDVKVNFAAPVIWHRRLHKDLIKISSEDSHE